MADIQRNEIKTRISLKYDTLTNWQTHNPVLLAGEVAFVQIGEVGTDNNGKRVTPPIMFKVGDGTSQFNSLGWGAATAADVYDWAKKAAPDWDDFSTVPVNKLPVNDIDTDNDTRTKVELGEGDNAGKLKVTTGLYVKGVLSGQETVEYIDILTPSELNSALNNYYTKSEVDELIQEAKEYADANDADTKYGIVYDSANKVIKLTNDPTQAEIDATAFIKDGMIKSVELVEEDDQGKEGQFLKITWDTDINDNRDENSDGKEDTEDITYLDVTTLVDVYEGVDGNDIKVTVSANNQIAAEIKVDALKTTLGLGSAAYADAANFKTKQDAVVEVGTANQTLKISQNENGVITATPVDIAITASQVSGLADIATTGKVDDLKQDAGTYILFNCGTASTVI